MPFGGEVEFVRVSLRVAALQEGFVADEKDGVGGLVEADERCSADVETELQEDLEEADGGGGFVDDADAGAGQ